MKKNLFILIVLAWMILTVIFIVSAINARSDEIKGITLFRFSGSNDEQEKIIESFFKEDVFLLMEKGGYIVISDRALFDPEPEKRMVGFVEAHVIPSLQTKNWKWVWKFSVNGVMRFY